MGSWGEFLLGLGNKGGASINFFSFSLFMLGETFYLSSIVMIGGFYNFFRPFLRLSVLATFLSVLKHFSMRYYPYLALECLLKTGVCNIAFF
jgi:hypothetical protein